jgi:hypothetical protein
VCERREVEDVAWIRQPASPACRRARRWRRRGDVLLSSDLLWVAALVRAAAGMMVPGSLLDMTMSDMTMCGHPLPGGAGSCCRRRSDGELRAAHGRRGVLPSSRRHGLPGPGQGAARRSCTRRGAPTCPVMACARGAHARSSRDITAMRVLRRYEADAAMQAKRVKI